MSTFLFSLMVQAESDDHKVVLVNNPLKIEKPVNFIVDNRLLLLYKSVLVRPNNQHDLFDTLSALTAQFNPAEHYLFLVIQAMQASSKADHNQVVALSGQANDLNAQISTQQLNQPKFSNLNLVLANSYAQLKQFDLAYLEKKAYLKKYRDNSNGKQDKAVALLTEKHEIVRKNQFNSLLKNQNKLKELQLANVEKQQQHQDRNFALIVIIVVVFSLLLFRQITQRKKLLVLSKTDALTGLPNRAELFKSGELITSNSIENNQAFSLILLDIDYFKRINDDYGHHYGDMVLKQVAKLGCEAMRSRDLFARLGGEGFVALLPNTDINIAKAVAERLNEKISQHYFEGLKSEGNITASTGVSTLQHENCNFDELLNKADLAMYQAKVQGRNQVVSYTRIVSEQERRSI
ncbi:MAG: GGDEF domain-containing protein [Colwellia sp.]